MSYHERQIATVIERRAKEFEAEWLERFNIPTRETNPGLWLFDLDPSCDPEAEGLVSPQDPKALQVFQGAYNPELEGYGFDHFARGASTVASILPDNAVSWMMDFVKAQVDAMNQRAHSWANPYPAIEERWLPTYSCAVTLALLTDDPTNWLSLLAYAAGMLWMLSFVRGLADRDEQALEDALFSKIKMGAYLV